jgi:hypothetical protein
MGQRHSEMLLSLSFETPAALPLKYSRTLFDSPPIKRFRCGTDGKAMRFSRFGIELQVDAACIMNPTKRTIHGGGAP